MQCFVTIRTASAVMSSTTRVIFYTRNRPEKKKNNRGWNIKIAEIRFVQRHNNIFLFHYYYEIPCLAFPEDDIGFIARDGERTCERQAPDFCARFRRFLYNNTLLCTSISSRPLGSVPEGDTSIPHLQSRMILSPVIRI